MRVLRLASSALTGGLYSALTPIVALLLLAPADYGNFSIVYLIHAFGLSLEYSIICEAWTRTNKTTETSAPWRDYSTSLVALSALIALIALVAAIGLPDLRGGWWLFSAAVFFAVYRNGVRYYSVSSGNMRRVAASDITGIAAFAIALMLLSQTSDLIQVFGAWLAAGILSSSVLRVPNIRWGSGLIAWIATHKTAIKPLLSDSLLMDAGAIGTPFLLVGFMGVIKFGIYRAVANVAMPVRILLEPIRPNIGKLSLQELFRMPVSLLIGLTTLIFTVTSYMALVVVVPLFGPGLGTLSPLVEFAIPTAIYVGTSVIGIVYFIACRANSSQREIMMGRIAQTTLVVLLPICGFVLFDLSGVIWGYAISGALSAVFWLRIAWAGFVHQTNSEPPAVLPPEESHGIY